MTEEEKIIEELTKSHLRIVTKLKELETITLLKKIISHECFRNPEYKWSLDNLEVGKQLGVGKFGQVYAAREKRTKCIVALKTLYKKKLVVERMERQTLREIDIQSYLNHPNILQLFAWFYDSYRIYIILEYAGQGELYRHLKSSPGGCFNEHLSAKYLYQVTDALQYCHQNEVMHLGIKPENLLLTTSGDVKLADFGCLAHAPSLATLDYLPPEMVEGREYYHYVDHWCLGVLGFEFLTGSLPFESNTSEETYKRIKTVDVVFPDYMSAGAIDLISKLLVYKAESRISLSDVMKHPWILDNK